MQQFSNWNHPSLFDTADRVLKFGLTDGGEFVGGTYREVPSSVMISKIIGRHSSLPNHKTLFSSSDVSHEGYINKMGSWKKNWKRRYFILRKDIHALCYYSSQEDLVFLGSIHLGIDSQIKILTPVEAEGNENVVLIYNENEETSKITLKFDNFEDMKVWVSEINNETHHLLIPNDEKIHWWDSLFQNLPLTETKNEIFVNGRNRETPEIVVDLVQPSEKLAPPFQDDESDEEGIFLDNHKVSTVLKQVDNRRRRSIKTLGNKKKIHPPKQDKIIHPPPLDFNNGEKFLEGNLSGDRLLSGYSLSLRLQNVCNLNDRIFLIAFGCQSGKNNWEQIYRSEFIALWKSKIFQEEGINDVRIMFNLLLFPIINNLNSSTNYQELKFVVYKHNEVEFKDGDPNIHIEIASVIFPIQLLAMFKSMIKFKMHINEKYSTTISKSNAGTGSFFNSSFLSFTNLSPTSTSSTNSLNSPTSSNEPPQITLGMIKLASGVFVNFKNILSNRLGLSSPYSEVNYSFSAIGGVVLSQEQLFTSKLSSSSPSSLLQLFLYEREGFMKSKLPSMVFASKERVKELDNQLQLEGMPTEERSDRVYGLKDLIKSSLSSLTESYEEWSDIVALCIQRYNEILESTNNSISSNLSEKFSGLSVSNSPIYSNDFCYIPPTEKGGKYLRRSVWKKVTLVQHAPMNLNFQLLSNKYFTFKELDPSSSINYQSNELNKIRFFPTITMGCPTCHEIRQPEGGGLRKLFADLITTPTQILLWIQAIQSPSNELLYSMIHSYPKEALSLFPNCLGNLLYPKENSPSDYLEIYVENEIALMKRKLEIANRIDICASQALSAALLNIRTIIHLATCTPEGEYLDILERNLKIGFLISFQSLLTSQGSELTMIEDAEIAALWLSLVTVRLVAPGSIFQSQTLNSNLFDNKDPENLQNSIPFSNDSTRNTESQFSDDSLPTSELGSIIFEGITDEVVCRRDSTGRIIVDLELSSKELDVVRQCVMRVSNYPTTPTINITSPDGSLAPFSFDPNPMIVYPKLVSIPRVIAVVELIGVFFTQGVNEMQTLANLSNSRDVFKQHEMNQSALKIISHYFSRYRSVLEWQLQSHTKEMVDALSTLSILPYKNVEGAQTPQTIPNQAPKGRRRSVLTSGIEVTLTGAYHDQQSRIACVDQLSKKVLLYQDRLLEQFNHAVLESVNSPYEKHMDLLVKGSELIRSMTGILCILCKSGKDRTSMSVTLDQARFLTERLGVINGFEATRLFRYHGVRRLNVHANTGQSMYAFNAIQRRALPFCLRPPSGSHSGNVMS